MEIQWEGQLPRLRRGLTLMKLRPGAARRTGRRRCERGHVELATLSGSPRILKERRICWRINDWTD